MSKELRLYKKYASFVKLFLLIGGICPITRELNIIYRYIPIWAIFSCFIELCAVGNSSLQNIENIPLLTASLILFGTILNVITKASCFFIHRKKLQQVNDILSSILEEILSEIYIKSVILFYLQKFYRLIYVQTVLMFVTSIIYSMKPMIIKLFYDVNITNVQYPLPLFGTFPWKINSILIWQLHYFFDVNILWFIFFISVSVDAFFGFCMFRISVILRFLSFEFKRSSIDDKNKRNKEKSYQQIFRECVEKHVLLLKCRNIIQEIYGPIILLVTITNAMSMCSIIFQLFQVNGINIYKIGTFMIYLILKLIQTFLYSWPGDVIFTEVCTNWKCTFRYLKLFMNKRANK
ncbi:uncharacterized protein LOC107997349 [Apis cerana]|uniref:uncharacterized protein LOC107997349 n=1 Tax=Apis cerana TaxID=7461 RepID=UPI002B233C50|nr:uncharacterized protein LOC107997349 [Apis cerana]